MTKLNKRVVDAAQARDKDFSIWNDDLPGFGLRVFRQAQLSDPVSGPGSKPSLYDRPARGLDTRTRAAGGKVQLGRIAKGNNPAEERQLDHQAFTVKQLCDLHLADLKAGLILGKGNRPKKATTIGMDTGRIQRHIIRCSAAVAFAPHGAPLQPISGRPPLMTAKSIARACSAAPSGSDRIDVFEPQLRMSAAALCAGLSRPSHLSWQLSHERFVPPIRSFDQILGTDGQKRHQRHDGRLRDVEIEHFNCLRRGAGRSLERPAQHGDNDGRVAASCYSMRA